VNTLNSVPRRTWSLCWKHGFDHHGVAFQSSLDRDFLAGELGEFRFVPRRKARSFISAKKTGTRISTWMVEVIMPPTSGVAIGFITSELMPLSHKSPL
jgi:hypothetical protein